MADASSDIFYETLEDGAWKDSFDKLLSPRPVLRELNVLKRDVRASFNINSSVENCSQVDGLLVPSCTTAIVPLATLPRIVINGHKKIGKVRKSRKTTMRQHGSISTPISKLTNPFKCSLSPVGTWKSQCFGKKKSKPYSEQFHATPINPEIIIADYAEEETDRNTLVPVQPAVTQELSPLLKQHKLSKPKAKKSSQRHVCFESVTENVLPKKTSLDIQRKLSNVRQDCNDQQRPTSLTLQPGKWRKSLNIWKRTRQQPLSVDNRRSSKYCSRNISLLDNSVELVDVVSNVAGLRKSILVTAEQRLTTSTTTDCSDWKKHVLDRCGQRRPLAFERLYTAENMKNCRKIGEGAYGEVFLNVLEKNMASVLKIIPIEGELEINGETQKTFEQILPEIIISMELCNLGQPVKTSSRVNLTSGFIGIQKVACVKGQYPAHLTQLWEEYNDEKCSENDHPAVFPNSQLYIVLELAFGGEDLEAFTFNNAEQAFYALQQIILTLAVGEAAFQFEHRDLHWGNILILNTNEKRLTYKLDNNLLTVPTKGVRITIIDYTLSRMTFDDICLYNDLSSDEELFTATGDYQFDIYRMMRDVLKNNWETFEPKTNVFWISYIIAKMIDGVSYKNPRTKMHSTHISKLKELQEIALDFKSAIDFAKYLRKLN